MEAGRELDALIAWVMGWRWFSNSDGSNVILANPKRVTNPRYRMLYEQQALGTFSVELPHYSTDIAAAWQVVESWKYNWNIYRDVGKCGNDFETRGDNLYRCIYAAPGMPMEGVTSETAPLAICLAALKAMSATSPATPQP